jgi:RimJ/RimL family protein N-acetyltransferase
MHMIGVPCKDHSAFVLRAAEWSDARLLWVWANESVTRNNSLNGAAITWSDHESWFAKKLSSPDCRIWIMQCEEEAVGQIRYERITEDTAEISFFIIARLRGKGFGSLLLRVSEPNAVAALSIKRLRAIVLVGNHASRRLFEKARFRLCDHTVLQGKECVVYERVIQT